MDIHITGMRDRRIAASDEYLDGSERGERNRFFSVKQRTLPQRGRFIYGRRTAARQASQLRPENFDVTRYAFSRSPDEISTIVLHSTRGRDFNDLPAISQDNLRRSYHRIDEVIAHFVICQGGNIVYTHDIEYILNCAGGSKGIDIEFAGKFDQDNRLSESAIKSGRVLIEQLKYPNSTHKCNLT